MFLTKAFRIAVSMKINLAWFQFDNTYKTISCFEDFF